MKTGWYLKIIIVFDKKSKQNLDVTISLCNQRSSFTCYFDIIDAALLPFSLIYRGDSYKMDRWGIHNIIYQESLKSQSLHGTMHF